MITISPAEYLQEIYNLDVFRLCEELDMYAEDAQDIMNEKPLTDKQAEELATLGRSKESWLAMDKDFQDSKK